MILKLSELYNFLRDTKNHQTLILVTGVFDLLHQAHKDFLHLAKTQGDLLLVGLETDLRVQKLKGQGRPIQNLESRMKNLDKLNLADYVFPLPEKFDSLSDYEKLIKSIKPNILAVSSHTPNLHTKKELVEKYGGQLKVVMNQDKTISTTQIMRKISKFK